MRFDVSQLLQQISSGKNTGLEQLAKTYNAMVVERATMVASFSDSILNSAIVDAEEKVSALSHPFPQAINKMLKNFNVPEKEKEAEDLVREMLGYLEIFQEKNQSIHTFINGFVPRANNCVDDHSKIIFLRQCCTRLANMIAKLTAVPATISPTKPAAGGSSSSQVRSVGATDAPEEMKAEQQPIISPNHLSSVPASPIISPRGKENEQPNTHANSRKRKEVSNNCAGLFSANKRRKLHAGDEKQPSSTLEPQNTQSTP